MPSDILFDHHDWSLLPAPPENCECAWVNPQGLMIGLEHLLQPDIGLREALVDLNAVRDQYRRGYAAEGMGLIECDIFDLDTVRAIRSIVKLIQQPPRAIYGGAITLPLPTESYMFNVAAEEIGISGVRDTAVWLKTRMELEAQGYEMELEVLRWAEDPYDPGYDGPSLRNLADAPQYDAQFPDHPLTQVRIALRCLMEGVRLSAELKQRANRKT